MLRGKLRERYLRSWQLLKHGEADGAGAGAQVEQLEGPCAETLAQAADKLLGPPFRLRTGDKGMRIESDGKPEEGNPSYDVGERLSRCQARSVFLRNAGRVPIVFVARQQFDILHASYRTGWARATLGGICKLS